MRRSRYRKKKEEEEKEPARDESEWELPVEPLVNILSFGWMEDGRLGYPPEYDKDITVQTHPRPLGGIRKEWGDPNKRRPPDFKQFVCMKAAAGARHSLFLMVNCRKENDRIENKTLKSKRLYLTGLNQLGLCEDKGHDYPVEIPLPKFEDPDDEPVEIAAGAGTSWVLTRRGRVYSFGQGRYGVLGHGELHQSVLLPKLVKPLNQYKVTMIAVGDYHVVCCTDQKLVLSWGKNNTGQCGRGFESDYELDVDLVKTKPEVETPVQLACGAAHTIILMDVTRPDESINRILFSWGQDDCGQLGSGDTRLRHTPQENRWLSKYCKKNNYHIIDIAAGGHFNMVRTDSPNYLITWGNGVYGQLARDNAWDDPKPRVILGLFHIHQMSCGRRHAMALRKRDGKIEVLGWGYNGYGELGLGDCNIRLTPSMITAIPRSTPLELVCGDRHTLIRMSHKPVIAADEPHLKPYFDIIKEGVSSIVKKQLKADVKRKGMDPALLDDPLKVLPGQAGSEDKTLRNQMFEPGLRYCMDTYVDPSDWRRKGVETCFEVPSVKLKSVCLACARNCHRGAFQRIYVRYRGTGDICDCARQKFCNCSWSTIRMEFDKLAALDGCIGPNNIRDCLQALRGPAPVDSQEVEECLIILCDNDNEDREEPRVTSKQFEMWYREFYQVSPLELETGHPDGSVTRTFIEEEDDGGRLQEDDKKRKGKGNTNRK